MTTAINKRRLGGRFARATVFGLLALVAALCAAPEARAQWATSGNNISNTNTGNVGVGTSNPATRLHATAPTGSNNGTVMIVPDGSNTYYAGHNHDALFIDGALTAPHGLYTGNTVRLMRIRSADNVDSLVVGKYGDLNATPTTYRIGHTFRLAPDASSAYHAGHNHDIFLINGTGLSNHGMYTGATVRLMRLVNAAGGDALTVARDGTATFGGNVDIGTIPAAKSTAKLNVGGDMNVTGTITGGNITAKYQDVAEWVPSTQKLGAATVVILDPQRSNQVLASTSAYDTSVAGVVSIQPGIALGERGEGKVLVATTGRVKVKVDATRAPVKVGDLLVTSEREGYAMKSEPMLMGGRKFHSPGTIVGKALEPLAGGTGEILVLLSLQ
jgi:hypothetical protein